MMNGAELNGEIGVGRGGSASNVVAELLRKNGSSPGRMYDDLFLMTLNRRPTDSERSRLNDVMSGRAKVDLGAPAPKGPKGPPPRKGSGTVTVLPSGSDITFYQDVLWALLNTNEFMLNH
jgi:hypothetical protein